MAWQIRLSVCRLSCLSSVTCLHPTQGGNFSGTFLHHIVAWSSGNSPTKNHEDRPRGSRRWQCWWWWWVASWWWRHAVTNIGNIFTAALRSTKLFRPETKARHQITLWCLAFVTGLDAEGRCRCLGPRTRVIHLNVSYSTRCTSLHRHGQAQGLSIGHRKGEQSPDAVLTATCTLNN